MNIPCILIPTLVGLICGILGYLIGRMRSVKTNDSLLLLQKKLDDCRENTKTLDEKIISLNGKTITLESDLKAKSNIHLQSFVQTISSKIPFDNTFVSVIYGKTIKENDLKIIEGIGPKIEALLNNAGIESWQTLSQIPTRQLQSILDSAGENYGVHNPGTWTRQAELACLGKWQQLKDWQDQLDGGKE